MLHSLRLSSFRCYSSLRWEIPAEGALLLGSNAQGKTSLLEALCFALTLHSPRADVQLSGDFTQTSLPCGCTLFTRAGE